MNIYLQWDKGHTIVSVMWSNRNTEQNQKVVIAAWERSVGVTMTTGERKPVLKVSKLVFDTISVPQKKPQSPTFYALDD